MCMSCLLAFRLLANWRTTANPDADCAVELFALKPDIFFIFRENIFVDAAVQTGPAP